jgi:hypothetical protein
MRKHIVRLRFMLFALVLAAGGVLAFQPGARAWCSGDLCGCYIEEQLCIQDFCGGGPTPPMDCVLACRREAKKCEKACCAVGPGSEV